jgi:hypothetical protein
MLLNGANTAAGVAVLALGGVLIARGLRAERAVAPAPTSVEQAAAARSSGFWEIALCVAALPAGLLLIVLFKGGG